MKYKDLITTVVEDQGSRVVLGLTEGAKLALRDIDRMDEHWLSVRDKPLAKIRQTMYCVWIGFTAPLLVTKRGREYSAFMRMAAKVAVGR